MRVLFLIEYDGTDFSGWQIQENRRTVQGVLNEGASRALKEEVSFTASGRTDAGVHALSQVAQAEISSTVPVHKLRECINQYLPVDVKIKQSALAPDGFDCTRGAKQKTYCYQAYFSPTERPLLRRYYARLLQKPQIEKMRAAAELLLGEHDFAAFRASGYTSKTSVREIYRVEIEEFCEGDCFRYHLSVTGNGFLYNMVRIIAGELFAIGCGKQEGITRAFVSKDRKDLAKTMPPQGLIMKEVVYETPIFGDTE